MDIVYNCQNDGQLKEYIRRVLKKLPQARPYKIVIEKRKDCDWDIVESLGH